MKKLIRLLVISAGLLVVTGAFAQTGMTQGKKGGTPSKKALPPKTGYGLAINTPLANNNPLENPSQKPLIVIAFCNATADPKDLEAWVGQNSPTTVQDLIASLSGTGRQAVTFVVPWGWHYYINVAKQPGGGVPPGGVCKATAWWTN